MPSRFSRPCESRCARAEVRRRTACWRSRRSGTAAPICAREHRAPGAGADLDVAGQLQRAVGNRVDRQRPAALGERPRCDAWRARRWRRIRPRRGCRRSRACAATSRSGTASRGIRCLAGQFDLRVQGVGAVLAHAHDIDARRGLRRPAVVALVGDRAGRAVVRDAHAMLDRRRFGVDPGPLGVGEEDHRRVQHALPRMNAAAPVEAQRDVAGRDDFGARPAACTPRQLRRRRGDAPAPPGRAARPRGRPRRRGASRSASATRRSAARAHRDRRRPRPAAPAIRWGPSGAPRCRARPPAPPGCARRTAAPAGPMSPAARSSARRSPKGPPQRRAGAWQTSATRLIADISVVVDAASPARRSHGSGAGANTCASARIISA